MITAEDLAVVREPLALVLNRRRQSTDPHESTAFASALSALGKGTAGAPDRLPPWLMPHQRNAVRRLEHALTAFGGAILADAVGLGKTYAALAIAARYRDTGVVVPANLRSQWKRVARELRCRIHTYSHESLSRQNRCRSHDLLIVDEAHWFRNAATRRYDTLARSIGNADVLLLTATPVVNRVQDLVNLLRLFLPDNALAVLGIDSLEGAHSCRTADLVYAMSPLVVARSQQSIPAVKEAIPHAVDHSVIRLPTVEHDSMRKLVDAVQELRFPSVGEDTARSILRLHMFNRLASSRTAALETIGRHLHYVERAIDAAAGGESLSRREMRKIFDVDDRFQLELRFPTNAEPVDAAVLQSEKERLLHLTGMLDCCADRDPKADRLAAILEGRQGLKTIVFTTATSSALSLARRLAWKRVAVVTGRGTRIASGRMDTDSVLSLFAPCARGAGAPHISRRIDVLVATDLVSEGLDLQDADCVIHYDIPWTPLRLQQRLGRVARLGSSHDGVSVWWFLPPPELEQHIRIAHRISQKVVLQLEAGVPNTSGAGTAGVTGGAFEWRERILEHDWRTGRETAARRSRDRNSAIFVVEWQVGKHIIPEVIAFEGSPPARVVHFETLHRILVELKSQDPAAPQDEFWKRLREVTRRRILTGSLNPVDHLSRRLTRRLLVLARRAGGERNAAQLELLDQILTRVTAGLRTGAARDLADILLTGTSADSRLRRWLARYRAVPETAVPGVRFVAAQEIQS